MSFVSLDSITYLVNNFQICLALLIVSVPEGLPLAISMALAFSFDRLTEDKVQVIRPEALENSGSLSEIVTCKTSILTYGNMSVHKLQVSDDFHEAKDPKMNLELFQFLADLITMNTNAYLETSDKTCTYIPRGSPLEVALVNFLVENNFAVQDLFVKRERHFKLLALVPFSSERKRMTVAYQLEEDGQTKVRVVVKGAPEEVVPLCIRAKNSDNETVSFEGSENEGSEYLDNVIGRMADIGYKPLTIAFKDYDLADFEPLQQKYFNFESDESRNVLESGLCHVASFSFQDEIRSDAAVIVRKL